MTLEEQAGKLMPTHDFQTPRDQPLEFIEETTYTGDRTVLKNQATRVWIHSLSTIIGSLIDVGLMITMFREHEFACSRRDAGRLTVRRDGRGLGRCANFGTRIQWDVATSRWSSPHSLVFFAEGEETLMA